MSNGTRGIKTLGLYIPDLPPLADLPPREPPLILEISTENNAIITEVILTHKLTMVQKRLHYFKKSTNNL